MKNISILLTTAFTAFGCQNNQVEQPVDCTQVRLEFTTTVVNTDCGEANGSITVTVDEGEGPFTYSLNDGPVQESPVFNGLSAGEYSIIVSDRNGCRSESVITVANIDGLFVTVSTTEADCGVANGTLSITAGNGVEPYEYQIKGQPLQKSPVFQVAPGTYEVFVIDAIGCEFSMTQRVNSNTSYKTDIRPIIMNNCAVSGCHDGSVSSLPNFSNLSTVQANAAEIRNRTQNRSMPPNGSLTQAQIDLIACWVDDGARDN